MLPNRWWRCYTGWRTVRRELQPLELLAISTRRQGELEAGSVTVDSDGRIGGVLRFDLPKAGVAVKLDAGNGVFTTLPVVPVEER